jgi:hypothetical protein
MIEFRINKNGVLEVGQGDISPSVYLDHWALRKFSESQILSDRLTAALKLRNGTLALSWLNLAEFTRVTVEEQARKAETLLEKILPQIFFLEVDFGEVIRREDDLLGGGRPTPPHADLDLLRMFSQMKPNSLNLFTAHDLFKVVQGQVSARFDDLANTGVDRIEVFREKYATNPEFQLKAKRLPFGPSIQRGTRFILREFVRALIVDKGIKITRNQVIDLFHAVVPIAYCDFVLLDKYWEAQVERVRSRLATSGISVPTARVFSGKADGIDRFLIELEFNEQGLVT